MKPQMLALWCCVWLCCAAMLTACLDFSAALPPSPSPFPTLPRLPSVTPVTPQPTRSPVTIILGPSATATSTTAQFIGRAATEANVRSGPGTSFPIVTVVPINTEVLLEGQRANWYVVRLPDGQTGWMSATVLEVAPEIAARIPIATP
ncbi:MAG: SH3 domain-containing protein [Chloroflexi bacterium]|jgi:hypothetical protein|nr:MAG: SH3 domain-containing protein [Chloroflexota bacterium]